MDEQEEYEKRREERWRKADKAKYASMIFREMVAQANHRRFARNLECPLDFKAMACEAVEAAEALLEALDDKPVDMPRYAP